MTQSAACSEPPGDHWVATLAHELRGSLGAVLMALDELRPLCAAEPTAHEFHDMAERVSKQMSHVIDDVLDLSRCARGKLSVWQEPIDLADVIHASIAAAKPLLNSRRHRLTVSIAPGLPAVVAHPSRLEQVLTNLLTNAAKFSHPGGHVRLTADCVDDAVRVCVSDDGIGIAPELLPHVFDAYRQGDAVGDGSPAGLGIGLALVKSLVELQGGSVSAHSAGPGRGSQFTLMLKLGTQLLAPSPGTPGEGWGEGRTSNDA